MLPVNSQWDDSVEGEERSNAGGSGNQERRSSVTTRARAAWEAFSNAMAAPITQFWAPRAEDPAAYAHVRAYDHARVFAHIRAYVLLAVKASGLLALLLSMVILLGGYVQSLGKKDFFCIMAISVIQAAGIFQDWETNLEYLVDFVETVDVLFRSFWHHFFFPQMTGLPLILLICAPLLYPFLVLVLCIELFYLFGPLACAGISSWRITKLNHGYHSDGTDSMTDMMATLYLFYSLIIFQGAMFFAVLLPMNIYRVIVFSDLRSLEKLSDKWGKVAIFKYLFRISTECMKDPLSIKGMDMIKYAAELLDSESQEDYLYGARLLNAFIRKGKDVSWALLSSRHRIQRLIDSLKISSSSSSSLDEACVQFSRRSKKCFAVIGGLDDKKEIREHAATIVAHVAADIDDLDKYPGAMRCISSLFQDQEETTQTYRRNNKQVPDDPPQHQHSKLVQMCKLMQMWWMRQLIHTPEERRVNLMRDQKRMAIRDHQHRNKREGGTSNKLVQEGLTILERLASNNDDNRSIICSTPALLPKITAPVYSVTLIQDVKSKAWADIVTRCLKVLYQLIRAPNGNHGIFSNNVQALSNLKSILELGNNEADHRELQLVAMEILTELPLDLSIELNKEIQQVLIAKQLQLFLANGDGTAMAGRALVSLSSNSQSNSALIMTTQDDIIDRLTGILDDDNITRRTIAAEIMVNLCAHCTVDNMKEILPKVLREIMSIKIISQERIISAGQNNSASGDEENQTNSVSTNNEEHNIFRKLRLLMSRLAALLQKSPTGTEEISDQEREEQEAFLSLAQVICDKVNSADLDRAIQNAVQNENNAGSEEQQREAFVDKLKTIIDCNRHPAAYSLRIVKLCSRIAKSVIRCEQYVEIFRNKGFKSSLSEASKTMSELECCMRFVGTDFGPKKTVRPLFSEIEESFGQI